MALRAVSGSAGGGGGATPGGSDTQVQYNKAGAFAGNSGLTYNDATGTLVVANIAGITGSALALSTTGTSDMTLNLASSSGTGRLQLTGSDRMRWASGGVTSVFLHQFLAAQRITASAAPTLTGGELWNDSTQKALTFNNAGNTLYTRALMFAGTTTQTVTNTITETTAIPTGIGNKTLAANILTPGKTINLLGGGVFGTTALTPSLTVRVKMGSTVLASATVTDLLGSATNSAFQFNCMITVRTSGATGTVAINGNINYETGALRRGFGALNNNGNTIVIDTTTTQALDVTVQWSAAATANNTNTTTATIEISG